MPQSVLRILYPILRISMLLDPLTATIVSSGPEGSFWLWPPQRLVDFPILVIEAFCVAPWKMGRCAVRSLEPEHLKR